MEESKVGLTDWLEEELKNAPQGGDFEKKPTPHFEENKITRMVVNATTPFQKWKDEENDKVKAIIPCKSMVDGKLQDCNWWLNTKNPVYKDVIHACRDAKDKTAVNIAITQFGTKQNTQYKLVKDE